MNCFYCGKRVSMVRKRVDADFCCDDHREKYHVRARRTIETLREADEQIAVTRRLNEGMPVAPNTPKRGTELTELLMRNPGNPVHFESLPTGLPVSRARLDATVPQGGPCEFTASSRQLSAPPPLVEKVRWNIGHVQEGPRPPRPFTISIHLPQGGARHTDVQQAMHDGVRGLRTSPPAELGARPRVIASRMVWRSSGKSIGGLMSTAEPPRPVKPPPSPPIVVTLRHATMAVQLGRVPRTAADSLRLPVPGMVGKAYAPRGAAARPPAPASVSFERRDLSILATRVAPAAMSGAHQLPWGNRSMHSPDGFRRRQFYSWEALERFCGMGFETIAGHRPGLRVAAAPDAAGALAMAHVWSSPLQDESTSLPEPRRPAPPFNERISLPAGVAARAGWELPLARPAAARLRMLDSRHHFPSLSTWDAFAASALVRPKAAGTILGAQWAGAVAGGFVVPA